MGAAAASQLQQDREAMSALRTDLADTQTQLSQLGQYVQVWLHARHLNAMTWLSSLRGKMLLHSHAKGYCSGCAVCTARLAGRATRGQRPCAGTLMAHAWTGVLEAKGSGSLSSRSRSRR